MDVRNRLKSSDLAAIIVAVIVLLGVAGIGFGVGYYLGHDNGYEQGYKCGSTDTLNFVIERFAEAFGEDASDKLHERPDYCGEDEVTKAYIQS